MLLPPIPCKNWTSAHYPPDPLPGPLPVLLRALSLPFACARYKGELGASEPACETAPPQGRHGALPWKNTGECLEYKGREGATEGARRSCMVALFHNMRQLTQAPCATCACPPPLTSDHMCATNALPLHPAAWSSGLSLIAPELARNEATSAGTTWPFRAACRVYEIDRGPLPRSA